MGHKCPIRILKSSHMWVDSDYFVQDISNLFPRCRWQLSLESTLVKSSNNSMLKFLFAVFEELTHNENTLQVVSCGRASSGFFPMSTPNESLFLPSFILMSICHPEDLYVRTKISSSTLSPLGWRHPYPNHDKLKPKNPHKTSTPPSPCNLTQSNEPPASPC